MSINVGNSFNCEHPNISKFSRPVNLSIDVGNSFNYEHHDKFNDLRAVNLLIDEGNSNCEHLDKSKF